MVARGTQTFMSTNNDQSELSPDTSDADLLQQLIRTEMRNIPIEHWGYFFPCQIAAWRFIETKRPGIFGSLNAGYDSEPYFIGKGARWFCDVLGNNVQYLDLVEAIIYPVTRDAAPGVRERVVARGFFRDSEIRPLDPAAVKQLAHVILEEVDAGERNGLIT